MTAGETEFPLRTLVYNLDRRRLEVFGTEQTPELRLGELTRIAMAGRGNAVRVEGEQYVDGGNVEPEPSTRLMLDRFDRVFAIDVQGRNDTRSGGRLSRVEPFDERVSAALDLYDLFIDRRNWPELMLSGYRATRDALTPFTKRPAARRSAAKQAAGS
jgi:predicted acylesterase/phospholipase RssA